MVHTRSVAIEAVLVSLVCFAFLGTVSNASADTRPEGKYRCLTIQAGHQTAPCQSPPLILSRDGSYQIWGERGTYEVVKGEWLLLSHSRRRGMGRFENLHEIVFEYKTGGMLYRVTFQQIVEPAPGVSRA